MSWDLQEPAGGHWHGTMLGQEADHQLPEEPEVGVRLASEPLPQVPSIYSLDKRITCTFIVYLDTQEPAEEGSPPLLPSVDLAGGHRAVQEVHPTHPLVVPLDKVRAGDFDLAPRLLLIPANGCSRLKPLLV